MTERLDDVLAAALGSRVRALRLAAGLSQAALAQRALTHRPVVGRIERGTHVPDLETMHRLARALDCDWPAFVKSVDWEAVDRAADATNLRRSA